MNLLKVLVTVGCWCLFCKVYFILLQHKYSTMINTSWWGTFLTACSSAMSQYYQVILRTTESCFDEDWTCGYFFSFFFLDPMWQLLAQVLLRYLYWQKNPTHTNQHSLTILKVDCRQFPKELMLFIRGICAQHTTFSPFTISQAQAKTQVFCECLHSKDKRTSWSSGELLKKILKAWPNLQGLIN